MRILLLNQFIPPDPAPTSRLLGDVGDELQRSGNELVWIGNASDYRGKKTLLGSRSLREISALLKLLLSCWFTPRKCDAILFLTSPPLLPLVACLSRVRHPRAKLIHWAMDIYPDVAVSLGEIRENSLITRFTSFLMSDSYRKSDQIVALDEAMAGRLERHGVRCKIQAPWPPQVPDCPPDRTSLRSRLPLGSFFWLYSGNLGRAHEWKTLLDAQKRVETQNPKIHLVFQGGGTERPAARHYAEKIGVLNCHWFPYVDHEELLPSLLDADALIATQKLETAGCLWPSKLSLASLTSRPLIWISSSSDHISRQFKNESNFFGDIDDASGLADHLSALARNPTPSLDFQEEWEAVQQRVKEQRMKGIRNLALIVENQSIATS